MEACRDGRVTKARKGAYSDHNRGSCASIALQAESLEHCIQGEGPWTMRAKGGTPSSGESAAGRLHRGRAVDEGELIRRVRAGERDAFAALIARYGGALLRFARLLVHDEVTAREMVQDAWLAVLDAADGFEQRTAFKTWLFGSWRVGRRAARLGMADRSLFRSCCAECSRAGGRAGAFRRERHVGESSRECGSTTPPRRWPSSVRPAP